MACIETMGIFNENSPSGFNPKYFATETDARNWLNEKFNTKDTNGENQKLAITFKGIDDDEKVVFELKKDASKFDGTSNLLKTILEQNHFMRNNNEKIFFFNAKRKRSSQIHYQRIH